MMHLQSAACYCSCAGEGTRRSGLCYAFAIIARTWVRREDPASQGCPGFSAVSQQKSSSHLAMSLVQVVRSTGAIQIGKKDT